jgi:hypothetical protein
VASASKRSRASPSCSVSLGTSAGIRRLSHRPPSHLGEARRPKSRRGHPSSRRRPPA